VAYGRERIIVASRGKPKAAVISLADLELLEALEATPAVREALAEYERGETAPISSLKWPTLDGGKYLGSTLRREEIYDDDGR
jgi:PHD/YefM family antitoxin component YafN of YafNO toxin-antitoxin module